MGLFSKEKPDISWLRSEIDHQNKRVRDLIGSLEGLERDVRDELRTLGQRIEESERSVRLMAEEMDERIDRGNKIWRRIRARERAEEERQEFEGEEPTSEDLSLFDGAGGNGQGMPPMYGDLGAPGTHLQPHQQIAREIARKIAGRG